ncbi:MAG: pilus assembly protein PilM [Candidatus Omnitrophota bacterium]
MNILEKLSFAKTKKETVSLDLGMDWFKLAAAETGPAGKKLTKLNVKKVTSFKHSFSKSIADAFKECGLKSNSVVTYLPRHLTTIRILELPSMDKNEIADMIELQVVKQTPYSREEIITNFKILGPAEKKGYARVMLVIVRKSIIEERLKLFREAGLEVNFIGLSSEMILELYRQVLKFGKNPPKDAVIGLIEMDSNFTDFLFFRDNNLIFTRSIFIGLENVLAEPQTWKDKFIEQIKGSLEIYKQQGLFKDVNKLVISEALEKVTGFSILLEESLNLPVEVVKFVESVPATEEFLSAASFHAKNVSLLPCLGALFASEEQELNFLPKQIQMRKKFEERSNQITTSGVLLLSILMIISGIFAERIYNRNRTLNLLKQEINKTTKEADRVEKMKLRIDMIRKYSDKKYSPLNSLLELYRVFPEEMYLTSFGYENGKQIILSGTSGAMSGIFQFVNVLENSAYFEKAKTNYVTKKKREGQEIVDFELICDISR